MTISLIGGRISSFLVLILILLLIVYFNYRTSKNKKIPELRRIPGIEAIDDAVKRCAELRRPVMFTPGIGGLTGTSGVQTMAAIGIMSYVTKLAAQLNIESIVALCVTNVVPMVEGIVRENYEVANNEYKPSYVRFVGANQYQLSIGVQGIMEREKPGANFMMGSFDEEAISIAEKGYRTGSIGIGGTTTTGQMGILAATMDYLLIGEELYAAGAYLSKDPAETMSIVAIDIWKIVAIAGIIIGVVLLNLGFPVVRNMLRT